MTTLSDRPRTALIVIDVQHGVMAQAYRRDAVVAHIGELVERARADGAPIVWVQHSDEQMTRGSVAWDYVPELRRQEPEPLVHKTFGDAFGRTPTSSRYSLPPGSDASSWPAPRRTPAYARRSTVYAPVAMT